MMRHSYRSGSPGRKLSRRVLLAASGSTGVLAACGRPGRSGSTARPAGGSAPSAPKAGGHLNVSMPADPFDFDPTGKPSENTNAIRPAYDSLLSFKTGSDVAPADTILEPAIAERWESPDGQTFIFHLRQGRHE
jgi:ABC-type transport system substrate-binding protein